MIYTCTELTRLTYLYFLVVKVACRRPSRGLKFTPTGNQFVSEASSDRAANNLLAGKLFTITFNVWRYKNIRPLLIRAVLTISSFYSIIWGLFFFLFLSGWIIQFSKTQYNQIQEGADAELGTTGTAGLASVETLDESGVIGEKTAPDNDDGMETVRLDADTADTAAPPPKQHGILAFLTATRKNLFVTGKCIVAKKMNSEKRSLILQFYYNFNYKLH